MVQIMALDVAYTNIGWAVIEPYTDGARIIAVGAIRNPSDAKKKKHILDSDMNIERIRFLYRELKDVLYSYDVKGIVAEIPGGGGKSHKATAGMARGTSVVACVVEQVGMPADWTTEADGKMALCRNRNASKTDMQAAAVRMFPEVLDLDIAGDCANGYAGWFEHAADAIAAYLAARTGTVVSMIATLNGKRP